MKCCFSAGIVFQKLFSKDSREHSTDVIGSNPKKLNKHYRNLCAAWKNTAGENKNVSVASELTGYAPSQERQQSSAIIPEAHLNAFYAKHHLGKQVFCHTG